MNERISASDKKPTTNSQNLVPRIRRKADRQSMTSPVDRILFLQRTMGNQAVGRLIKSGALQAKLRIGQPNDIYEQEADRVAEQVMRMPDVSEAKDAGIQRKCPKCLKGLRGLLGKDKKEEKLQAKEVASQTPEVNLRMEANINALKGSGQRLPESMRAFFEPRFGRDFSDVRVHSDAKAADMARAVNAQAYAVGKDVVFGAGKYMPETLEGKRLISHELTHVVQQHERSLTDNAVQNSSEMTMIETPAPSGTIQRQFITSLAQGGGFSGLMERDRRRAFGPRLVPTTPFQVCARALQISPYGNHAYIEAPPYRYAIISPTCPVNWYDNPITGTGGQKWDNSPDPCSKTPACIDCLPAPGITDVASCLRDAFTAYNNPSLYRLLGPNSNTFAGTLARACCAGMVPKPSVLGWVPGWDNAPAPARPAPSKGCPPGPKC